jgi:hypothetical protein
VRPRLDREHQRDHIHPGRHAEEANLFVLIPAARGSESAVGPDDWRPSSFIRDRSSASCSTFYSRYVDDRGTSDFFGRRGSDADAGGSLIVMAGGDTTTTCGFGGSFFLRIVRR